MQVNLHGSLRITVVFLYCYGHREKNEIKHKGHDNTPFWP